MFYILLIIPSQVLTPYLPEYEDDQFYIKIFISVLKKIGEDKQISVLFYVDDLLAACAIIEALEKLCDTLVRKYEKMKVTRRASLSWYDCQLPTTRSSNNR